MLFGRRKIETIKDLVLRCRSYRRFYEEIPVGIETLRELVDIARCTASASNRQPLKYILSASSKQNTDIFSCLRWAALIKWDGPAVGERPSAYIVVLNDREVSLSAVAIDHGIAAQTILLGAVEKGFGGCMLAAVDRDKLRALLDIAPRYDILLVIALGKPREEVVIDPLAPGGNTNYWRDENGVHHVPKRRLKDVVVAEY